MGPLFREAYIGCLQYHWVVECRPGSRVHRGKYWMSSEEIQCYCKNVAVHRGDRLEQGMEQTAYTNLNRCLAEFFKVFWFIYYFLFLP